MSAGDPVGMLLRRGCSRLVVACTVSLVVLAVGAALGRWRILPVADIGDQTDVAKGSLALVVPVPAATLHEGDTIYLRTQGRDLALRRVVAVVDSWQHTVQVDGPDGDGTIVRVPDTTWRVSRAVPYVGAVFALLVGPAQAVLLVLTGMSLVVWAELRMRRRPDVTHPTAMRTLVG